MTTMSMLFSRKALIPLWLVVFGLFAVFGSTFATGVLLFLVGAAATAIVLILRRKPFPTIAEVLHHVETS